MKHQRDTSKMSFIQTNAIFTHTVAQHCSGVGHNYLSVLLPKRL